MSGSRACNSQGRLVELTDPGLAAEVVIPINLSEHAQILTTDETWIAQVGKDNALAGSSMTDSARAAGTADDMATSVVVATAAALSCQLFELHKLLPW